VSDDHPIQFACPHCRAMLGAARELAGRPAVCPKCNKRLEVPQESQSAAEPAPKRD